MLKMKWLLVFNFFWLICNLHAVEVTTVNIAQTPDKDLKIDIGYQGRIISPPHFIAYGETVAIKWPQATALNKSNQSEVFDLKQEADSLLVVIKNRKISASDIFRLSLKLSGDKVSAQIPLEVINKLPVVPREPKTTIPTNIKGIEVVKEKSPDIVSNKQNEDYLSYLLSSVDRENQKTKDVIKDQPVAAPKSIVEVVKKNAAAPIIKSETNLNKTIKEGNNNLMSYMLRILLVLCFVVGVILVLAKLSKKLMVGKNKLGFLHSSKVVEVLNTTYIGPKRQLLLVKVYDQVLLLGNAENGLTFISEVKDLSNILKVAEQEVTGSNFDTNMDKNPVGQVLLKDEKKLFESKPLEDTSSKTRSALKNKVRSLKAWQ